MTVGRSRRDAPQGRAAGAFVLAAFLALPVARAQGRVLVLGAAPHGDRVPEVVRLADRLREALAARGVSAISAGEATAAVERRLPLPQPRGGSMAALLHDAHRALYHDIHYPKARALYERIRREARDCADWRKATLLLAVIELLEQRPDAAAKLLDEVAHAEPGIYLSPADHPPPLRRLFRKVQARLDAGPTASLTIVGKPLGVRVHVGRCLSGKAPFTIAKLYPGTYEIWPEGGRIRRVPITSGSVTVDFDLELDQAIRTSPSLALVGQGGPRAGASGTALARLVGAGQVVVVEMREGGVAARVLRVADGAVLREGQASLRALEDLATYLATGERVGTLRTELLPPPAPASAASSSRWYRKWWVWTVVGIGAAGAAAAGIALTRSAQGPAVIVSGTAP